MDKLVRIYEQIHSYTLYEQIHPYTVYGQIMPINPNTDKFTHI
jgi:hypothetical protein